MSSKMDVTVNNIYVNLKCKNDKKTLNFDSQQGNFKHFTFLITMGPSITAAHHLLVCMLAMKNIYSKYRSTTFALVVNNHQKSQRKDTALEIRKCIMLFYMTLMTIANKLPLYLTVYVNE